MKLLGRADKERHRQPSLGLVSVMVVSALFFALPLVAMARFAFQSLPMVSLGWDTIFDRWTTDGVTSAFTEEEFQDALVLSGKLAAGTVLSTLLLLVPTTMWVHIRIPKARSLVEFFTVLPYVIPPIALVAGVLPLKQHARWFLNSNYSLIPFYTVLALPFTYRALDAGFKAIDVMTLVNASRNLGASWITTLARVVIPNIRGAIISASFLTGAVVLGEYTVARTLLKRTLPAFMAQYQGREPQGGMALALVSLLGTTAIFGLLSVLTKPRQARSGARDA